MPDWVYAGVESFVTFMNSVTLADMLILAVANTAIVPFLVLIHEAGHALAALAVRRRVLELTVGDDEPFLTVRASGFRFHLGAITGRGDVAGFVLWDATEAGPRDTFVIALAGPLASLAGGLVAGAMAVWAWPHAGLAQIFGLATVGGVMCCVGNLRVSGDSPASWSDGVWVRAAWRAMRRPAPAASAGAWADPHEATSTPPPRSSTI